MNRSDFAGNGVEPRPTEDHPTVRLQAGVLNSETKDVGDIDIELDRLAERYVDRSEVSSVTEN